VRDLLLWIEAKTPRPQLSIGIVIDGYTPHGRDARRPHRPYPHIGHAPRHPGSVPINALVPVAGTPLGDTILSGQAPAIDGIEFARTVAAARITMPRAVVRLSAGRETMSTEAQALAFLAGANSIFVGDRLLTTANPGVDRDAALFETLGLVSAA